MHSSINDCIDAKCTFWSMGVFSSVASPKCSDCSTSMSDSLSVAAALRSAYTTAAGLEAGLSLWPKIERPQTQPWVVSRLALGHKSQKLTLGGLCAAPHGSLLSVGVASRSTAWFCKQESWPIFLLAPIFQKCLTYALLKIETNAWCLP